LLCVFVSLSSDKSRLDMHSSPQTSMTDRSESMECRSPGAVEIANLATPSGWNLPGSPDQDIEAEAPTRHKTRFGSDAGTQTRPTTLLARSGTWSCPEKVSKIDSCLSPRKKEVTAKPMLMHASSMHSRISRNSGASLATRTSRGTRASENFNVASESLILFDWDDTLCPTTACGHLVKSDQGASDDPLLRGHAEAVAHCLYTASNMGRVVIVTMAQRCWFDSCVALLMPQVADVLKELKIEVVCARESTTQRLRRLAFSDDRNPSQYLKTKAMERVIKNFYKAPGILTRESRSWKNIVSVGDSVAERLALQDLVFRHSQRGRRGEWKECRCKTLLLVEEPSLAQLTKEVLQLPNILQTLVNYDGDYDGDYEEDYEGDAHTNNGEGC